MTSVPDVPNAKNRDQDLFDPVIPITWLADEALFSLCSRHHRLSGHRRAATTCTQLFGHPTQGAAHDFPSRIGEFALRTRGQLGSASQVVRQHTILPFYLPFQSQETAGRAVAAMQGPKIGSLKFQLGLLTSRFRANHPLKACPVCIRADREQWSTPYWHVRHQLPGVWVCPQHQEPLMVSSLKATGVQRFQWMLPSPSHLIARTMTPGSATPLLSLAQASCELWGRPPGEHFEAEVVADVYRDALRHLGLLTGMGTGRLRLRDIGTPFAEYLAPLRQVDELSALPQSLDEAAREVARLAYRPRSGMHPLRHLILIGWLFGKFDTFVEHYRAHANAPPLASETTDMAAPAQMTRLDPLRQCLLDLVKSGASVSGASRQLGVDPVTGMAWAAHAGVKTAKRPSVIRGELRQAMMTALERGDNKDVVSALAGVSIESVTRLLRTEVGLSETWRRARRTKAQTAARNLWQVVVANNPLLGVKAVRMLEPAAYAWLYRNDKLWLDDQVSRQNRLAHGPVRRVDWDARDRELADAVQRAGCALAATQPSVKIKLWQIYQTIPDLKAKLAKLERLPLTRLAIRQTLSASTEPNAIAQGN